MNTYHRSTGSRGFTLTELMMAVAVMTMVISGTLGVYFTCGRCYWNTDVQVRAARISAMAVQKLVYGVNGSNGIRSAFSTNISASSSSGAWTLSYSVPDGSLHSFYYRPLDGALLYTNSMWGNRVTTVATHIAFSSISNSATGVDVAVRSMVEDGRFSASNTFTTFIHYRN